MNPNNTKFLAIISSIQKISIYETKSVSESFFCIGKLKLIVYF